MDNNTSNEPKKMELNINYTFYSNAFTVAKNKSDTFIDFIQLPPQNNAVPAIRVYMAPQNLDEFIKLLLNFQHQSNE
jgi:hypothetical protein